MPNALNNDLIFMVECAIQAPSGHNTQPWLFEINGCTLFIYPDFSRRLPVVDVDDRELFISLGCAAENLCLAAAQLGYGAELTVEEDARIAIRLSPLGVREDNVQDSALIDCIAQRQTNRSVYDGRFIPEEVLNSILQPLRNENAIHIAAWSRKSPEFERLSQYVIDGNTVQMNDAAFKAELMSWIRFNKKQAQQTRDGLSYAALGAPSLPAWISRPIVQSMLNSKRQNASDLQKIQSSSHLVLIASPANTVAAWVETGRVLQRLLLRLTQAGIAHAYLNQPCEVPALNQRLRAEFCSGQAFPQILLRIGYGKRLPQAQRRPLSAVIRSCT